MRLKNVKNAKEIIEKGTYYLPNPKDYIGRYKELFNNKNEIHIEIGMGKGKFIIDNAIAHKDINYIGIEKYDSVIVRAIQKSNQLELPNLKLIKIDALELDQIFNKEVDLIYLNFSDPWPKDRHTKRRLTSPTFLSIYDKISKNKPHIIQKTDNIDLFNYSLDTLKDNGYEILSITNDLHSTNIPNINTEYEDKFVSNNIKINRLEAIKK